MRGEHCDIETRVDGPRTKSFRYTVFQKYGMRWKMGKNAGNSQADRRAKHASTLEIRAWGKSFPNIRKFEHWNFAALERKAPKLDDK